MSHSVGVKQNMMVEKQPLQKGLESIACDLYYRLDLLGDIKLNYLSLTINRISLHSYR